MRKIEKKVADTILSNGNKIEIGGKIYDVAPPSIATLVMVSERISELPELNINSKEDIAKIVLSNARFCGNLGEILAILILGAKAIKENREKTAKMGIMGLFRKNKNNREPYVELAEEIMDSVSPAEYTINLTELLKSMEIGDFFGITTFLNEVNMIKPTRGVED